MNDVFDTPSGSDIARDRYGRPLIIPPDGGKPTAYTRTTTFIDCLEDTYHLSKWRQRKVAEGLVAQPDLLEQVASASNKGELDAICEAAAAAAGAGDAARTGTELHSLTEASDRGELYTDRIPAQHMPDVISYQRATTALEHLHIEQLMVCDALKVAGTPDRISLLRSRDGKKRIADIKTGSLDYGLAKIEMQLALYAHSALYDPGTGQRSWIEDLDQEQAIVIHLPAGKADARLYYVDIAAGWDGVVLAEQVRAWRRRRHVLVDVELAAKPNLQQRIAAAASADDLTAIWMDAYAAGAWTDELTAAAAARKAELVTAAGSLT